MEKTLSELLLEVDALFSKPQESDIPTYNYTLGKFPRGWSFGVTNNWRNWFEADLKHDFRTYERPEDAVRAFLDYVAEYNINVAKLME